ncbi:hypothetical protein [Pectobacterium brasiliense]|uniref:hypothetical protein n=1 Tax=Pectobacterium brasiliense TaxID=180957 RepID=UPI001968A5BF|nr:hypothetical protein [Pectobacterium brasiliense]MBN3207170.1 hypothetical protein [Pectobacterium brasiliense]MDY4380929.1 hypothetical protein [Pectobacterium brasiliense]
MTTKFFASQKIIEMDNKYAASAALCAVGFYVAFKTYQNANYIASALVVLCTIVRFGALILVVIADLRSCLHQIGTRSQKVKLLMAFLVNELGLILAFGAALAGLDK